MFGLFANKTYLDLSVREASQRGDLLIIDVREPSEFVGQLGRIPGAINLPLSRAMTGLPDDVDQSKPVLLVCRSGGRSGRAASALGQKGYTSLHNLTGGMLAWNAEGLPVERED